MNKRNVRKTDLDRCSLNKGQGQKTGADPGIF